MTAKVDAATPAPAFSRTLVVAAAILAAAAIWLVLHNPRIGGTSYGVPFRCSAPWDTVLNGAGNEPGGSSHDDAVDIAMRCRAAGATAFAWGSAAVGGSAVALLAAVGPALAQRLTQRLTQRRARPDTPQ